MQNPPNVPLIANVSDTPRWVAAYRAQESARPDASSERPVRLFMIFPDPDPRDLGKKLWGAVARFERSALG